MTVACTQPIVYSGKRGENRKLKKTKIKETNNPPTCTDVETLLQEAVVLQVRAIQLAACRLHVARGGVKLQLGSLPTTASHIALAATPSGLPLAAECNLGCMVQWEGDTRAHVAAGEGSRE